MPGAKFQMADPTPLNWEFYQPSRHDHKSGLYCTTILDCGYGPRYIGESLIIGNRIRRHEKDARAGDLTLFMPSSLPLSGPRSPAMFAAWWEEVAADDTTSHLYVPGDPVKVSGSDFWRSCTKLISIVETDGFPSQEAAKAYLQILESRVQQDAKEYYESLLGGREITWRIPRPLSQSELFGRQWHAKESSELGFTIQYSLNSGPKMNANAFFVAVADAIRAGPAS